MFFSVRLVGMANTPFGRTGTIMVVFWFRSSAGQPIAHRLTLQVAEEIAFRQAMRLRGQTLHFDR
jgi:hypothetical protein